MENGPFIDDLPIKNGDLAMGTPYLQTKPFAEWTMGKYRNITLW